MRIAITGAGGFVGRHVLERCIKLGHSVRALSRRADVQASAPAEVQVLRGDLALGDVPVEFVDGIDVLFHCAAEIRDDSLMRAVNEEGTRNLIRLASGRVGRWVQLSSVGVYGSTSKGSIDERSLPCPDGPYETSKAVSDELVIEAATSGAFEFSILRPSIVFGRDMPNRSLPQLIEMVRRRLFFFIGPAGAMANYVHVSNVADALCLCAFHPSAAGRVYNLSDDRTLEAFIAGIARLIEAPMPSIRVPLPMAEMVAAVFGKIPGFPLTPSRVRALCNRRIYPSDRICAELGYVHRVCIEKGLPDMLGVSGHER